MNWQNFILRIKDNSEIFLSVPLSAKDEDIDNFLLNKKALTSVTSTVNYKTEENNNQTTEHSFHTKNLDQVALNRLQRNEYIEQPKPRMIRESEASKIVDQFFTKNLKK